MFLVVEPLKKQHPNIQHLQLGVSTSKSAVLERLSLQIQGEKNSASEGGDREGEGGGVHAAGGAVSGRDEDGSGEAEQGDKRQILSRMSNMTYNEQRYKNGEIRKFLSTIPL